jgi:hypothetical protein
MACKTSGVKLSPADCRSYQNFTRMRNGPHANSDFLKVTGTDGSPRMSSHAADGVLSPGHEAEGVACGVAVYTPGHRLAAGAGLG